MFNDSQVLLWNFEKTYLRDLDAFGVPIPQTLFLKSTTVTIDTIKKAARDHGWDRAVVKPSIGAGSYNVFLVNPNAEPTPPERVALSKALKKCEFILLQEYIPNIELEGEWGLVYINSKFSHAVLKTPRSGDFRLGINFDHVIQEKVPEDIRKLADKAHAALKAMHYDVVYSRVDILRRSSGEPLLLELEVLDPWLYFADKMSAADELAKTLVERIHKPEDPAVI